MAEKKWKRRTDNKMRYSGEIDWHRGLIRINKKRSRSKASVKRHGKKNATILDTIVHEEEHRKHPKMHEKTVRKRTKRKIKKMSRRQKKKQYSRYK